MAEHVDLEIDHVRNEDGTRVTATGVLVMRNQGRYDLCSIDVRELVAWLREHRPDLLE
jgi:hypothetical protein